jgi:tetratricopeptide (TPR) repeat protein
MKTALKFGLCLALLALVNVPAMAQQQGSGQQQGQQQQPPPTGQLPGAAPAAPAPAVNPEEEKAYEAFYKLGRTENDKAIEAGEAFLKTYPESRYKEAVYQKMATAYFSKNDMEKFAEFSEKTLELNPDNVDILPMMALVMPRRIDPGGLGGQEKLARVEGYAKRGIELLNAMQKPEAMAQEDFDKARNEKLSMCRSGLGIVYYQKQRFADSAAELEQAVKMAANPDPSDVFILGMAYQNARRFADAAGAFERCSQVTWAWQERCKAAHAEAKKLAATSLTPPKQ